MAESTLRFRSSVRSDPSGGSAPLTLQDLSGVAAFHVQAGRSGAPSPVRVGFAARDGGEVRYSVSPGEWFVLSGDGNGAEVPDGASAVDITHTKAVFRVRGADASRMLEKVCALDFDDRFMPDGSAARTSVAKSACEVLRLDVDDMPAYLVVVGRSLGAYLFDALLDAAAEFSGAHAPSGGEAL